MPLTSKTTCPQSYYTSECRSTAKYFTPLDFSVTHIAEINDYWCEEPFIENNNYWSNWDYYITFVIKR